MMRRTALSLIALFLLPSVPAHTADSRMNRSAQDLAQHLAPVPPAAKANPGDLNGLRQRMITIIEKLEASSRGNGPGPESLLSKAYDFRDDIAPVEQLLTSNAILDAWREAAGRGLFNEIGKYYGTITKGRGEGQECVFELIVPAEAYPPGSNQLANLRLVPAELRRTDPAKLNSREQSYRGELEGLIAEKARSRVMQKQENPESTNALGMTADEVVKRWERDMAAAGEAAKETPNIRLAGRVTGTPSHSTGRRWRVTIEVANTSPHPTEITLDTYLVGHTWKKRDYYLMVKTSQPVKLIANETRALEFFTKPEGDYKKPADDRDGLSKEERARSVVRYRGFIAVARHGDKGVSFTGTDQRLAEFGNPDSENSPLGRLPTF